MQILTHFAVREDAHILYGFLTATERDLFRLLINTVSGIGPRIALSILSSLSVSAFRSAVAAGDFKALSAVNGVGKKTAERIVVELKDKLIALGGPGALPSHPLNRSMQEIDTRISDAVSALMALGVKPQEATDTVRASLQMLGNDATTDQIIRASLRRNG